LVPPGWSPNFFSLHDYCALPLKYVPTRLSFGFPFPRDFFVDWWALTPPCFSFTWRLRSPFPPSQPAGRGLLFIYFPFTFGDLCPNPQSNRLTPFCTKPLLLNAFPRSFFAYPVSTLDVRQTYSLPPAQFSLASNHGPLPPPPSPDRLSRYVFSPTRRRVFSLLPCTGQFCRFFLRFSFYPTQACLAGCECSDHFQSFFTSQPHVETKLGIHPPSCFTF